MLGTIENKQTMDSVSSVTLGTTENKQTMVSL